MILDTNALSAFFDGDQDIVHVCWKAFGLYVPVMVLGEYRFGLLGSRQGKERGQVLNAFIETCTVLPVVESTCTCYASIRHELKRAGTPIPENDVWISALAVEHSLPVLSRDAHFDKVSRVERLKW
ncbi:MAG: type II toxin-antitoxin system VapC family toxin [Kiritimatiellia bacterium]